MHVDENPMDQLNWRTSSFCSNGACVEIAVTDDSVLVADSKESRRQALVYTKEEWRDFIAGVKGGEFDV